MGNPPRGGFLLLGAVVAPSRHPGVGRGPSRIVELRAQQLGSRVSLTLARDDASIVVPAQAGTQGALSECVRCNLDPGPRLRSPGMTHPFPIASTFVPALGRMRGLLLRLPHDNGSRVVHGVDSQFPVDPNASRGAPRRVARAATFSRSSPARTRSTTPVSRLASAARSRRSQPCRRPLSRGSG
jgi:hypothetical protein